MSDFRAFASTTEHSPAVLKLSPGESHHLVVVNRAQLGDIVVAFDGRGTEWTCTLSTHSKREAVLTVRSTRQAKPLPFAITLAQALPKGGVMDDIVRHATELGAARIVPLATERTQVHLDEARSDKKAEKWRVVALEAAKQCGNPFLPEIAALQSLAEFLSDTTMRSVQLKLIASLHPDAQPLRALIAAFRAQHGQAPTGVVWLVGPEGDFVPEEMRKAIAAGFVPVTLGPLVLRCDTAATAALSVLSYENQA